VAPTELCALNQQPSTQYQNERDISVPTPTANFLPPSLPVYYHSHGAIRADQTPNRPRAAACPGRPWSWSR